MKGIINAMAASQKRAVADVNVFVNDHGDTKNADHSNVIINKNTITDESPKTNTNNVYNYYNNNHYV